MKLLLDIISRHMWQSVTFRRRTELQSKVFNTTELRHSSIAARWCVKQRRWQAPIVVHQLVLENTVFKIMRNSIIVVISESDVLL